MQAVNRIVPILPWIAFAGLVYADKGRHFPLESAAFLLAAALSLAWLHLRVWPLTRAQMLTYALALLAIVAATGAFAEDRVTYDEKGNVVSWNDIVFARPAGSPWATKYMLPNEHEWRPLLKNLPVTGPKIKPAKCGVGDVPWMGYTKCDPLIALQANAWAGEIGGAGGQPPPNAYGSPYPWDSGAQAALWLEQQRQECQAACTEGFAAASVACGASAAVVPPPWSAPLLAACTSTAFVGMQTCRDVYCAQP